MPTRNDPAMEMLLAAGWPVEEASNPRVMAVARALHERVREDPDSVVTERLRLERMHREAVRQRNEFRKGRDKAARAAGELEKLMKDLLHGNAVQGRLLRVRETAGGPRAICRIANQQLELSIHPDVAPESLVELEPWDYLCVNEKVVVGTWSDDPWLFESALGDVVEFRGYHDEEKCLVRIARSGQDEQVVKLARPLREETLTAHTRLVLHRDDPGWAIARTPTARPDSRFEVPIDEIQTRLDDLACMDEVSVRFIEDVLLRMLRKDLRSRFDLDPMKGALLVSYKPGMGKTAFARAFVLWLHDLGQRVGFDVVLYVVQPNQTKSMWHGEDARIVREDLWGAIRARQAVPRTRSLFQIVICDEIDSLGKRGGPDQPVTSAAASDALEAFLAEMDGMIQGTNGSNPPAHVLCIGMTNRPDRLDAAAKRPRRFGDLVLDIPEIDIDGAEDIMMIYARSSELPWYLDDSVVEDADSERVRAEIVRPALDCIFSSVVLRYSTDTQRSMDVTAGQVLAGVHFMDAMNAAKRRAAVRELHESGVPAVGFHDVAESLVEVALSEAAQMEADPGMLVRQLRIKVPVARVEVVPRAEISRHRFLRQPAV